MNAFFVPLASVSLLVLAACGPSFQVVYEGDARFEHCYALDDTPTISLEEKTDCWSQWVRSYTYGQTRNRIDYASGRAKALRAVPAMPTDEAIMSAAPGEGISRVGHDEPATTNAFAPPPTTMSAVDGGGQSRLETAADENPTLPAPVRPVNPNLPVGAIVPDVTPRESCTDRCRGEWQVCRASCKPGKCAVCDRSYGGCMKSCF